MNQHILCYGPPPLTVESADAALETIHFIAAAVGGFDAIGVTNAVRPLWRTHLASCYPHIPIETRYWFVNAPAMLAHITANWPYLDPWTRGAWLQQWNMELPNMLWILEPVLAEARPANAVSQADAINALDGIRKRGTELSDFNTRMTGLTIGLMNSMKR